MKAAEVMDINPDPNQEPILIGQISTCQNYVDIRIGTRKAKALVDSGNSLGSCVSQQFFEELGLGPQDLEPLTSRLTVATASKGVVMEVRGKVRKPIYFYIGDYPDPFMIRPYVIPGLGMPMNLSKTFLVENKIDELHSVNVLRYQGSDIPMSEPSRGQVVGQIAQLTQRFENADVAIAYLDKKIVIPAGEIAKVPLHIPKWDGGGEKKAAFFEADPAFFLKSGCLPERKGEVKANAEGQFEGQVMNIGSTPVTLCQGMRYGELTFVDAEAIHALFEICAMSAPSEEEMREKIRKGFKLNEPTCVLKTPEEKKKAEDLLFEFRDCFSWDGSYGRTDLIKHYIPVKKGTRPIASRVRPMNPILESNFKAQLDDWISHGIVKPSKSEWNSTVVPVPKKVTTPGKPPDIRYCLGKNF